MPEQLLAPLLLLGAERRARLLVEGRGLLLRLVARPGAGALGPGQHEPPPRARHRHVQQAAHLGDVRLAACSRAAPPSAARSGTGSRAPRRAPGIRLCCTPST